MHVSTRYINRQSKVSKKKKFFFLNLKIKINKKILFFRLNLPSGLGHDDEHKRGNRVDVDDAHAEIDDENEDEGDDDDFNMHDPDGNHIQVMRLQQNNINSVDMKANNIERSMFR